MPLPTIQAPDRPSATSLPLWTAAALVMNFLWFDLPTRGGAFAGVEQLLEGWPVDGMVLFLGGLVAAGALAALRPAWVDRPCPFAIYAVGTAGSLAMGLLYAALFGLQSTPLLAVGLLLTGFFNVWLLVVDTRLMALTLNRRAMCLCLVGVFAVRYVALCALDDLGTSAVVTGLGLALPLGKP